MDRIVFCCLVLIVVPNRFSFNPVSGPEMGHFNLMIYDGASLRFMNSHTTYSKLVCWCQNTLMIGFNSFQTLVLPFVLLPMPGFEGLFGAGVVKWGVSICRCWDPQLRKILGA